MRSGCSLLRSMVSRKVVTSGRSISETMRRPPMALGETTQSAPARRSLASALPSMAFATMRSAGLSARAVTVT